jgi:hypothetical protein
LRYQEKIFNKNNSISAKLFLLFFLSALFLSCSDNRESEYLSGSLAEELPAYLPETAEAKAAEARDFGTAAVNRKVSGAEAAAVMHSDSPGESSRMQGEDNKAERKKTYSGGCTIQSASPAETILEAGKIARNSGGWIESSSESHAAVRVPSSSFRKSFNALLRLGNVLDKYEEASDVTGQYTDLDARLDILLSARKRIEKLLSAEKETEKKLPIFRELKRIDDKIEQLRAELKMLDDAVSYARIMLNIVPYNYYDAVTGAGFFPWIGSLDPFSVTIKQLFRKTIVPLPDGFAMIRGRGIKHFHAESSDGTVVRMGTIDNDPEGDSLFWQKAIIHGIGSRFDEFEEGESGNLKYVVLTGKDLSGYKYLAGTIIRRKLLYVVEIYFPAAENYEKWIEILKDSLGRIEIR